MGKYSTLDVRTRAVAAIRGGMRTNDVAFAFGVDRTTVFRWKRRYVDEGNLGLQRKPGSGRPRKLEGLSEKRLRLIVLSPASDYGLRSDLQTGEEVRRMIDPAGRHWTTAFAPNGRTILSGGDDKIIRLWDVQTGELLAQLEGHTDTVRRATYSPDGRFVASASHDFSIRLWKLPDATEQVSSPRR